MPQKAKFSKQTIAEAALKIAEERGVEFISARAIAAELNSSARPIFTVFKNMDEVYAEVTEAADAIYQSYVKAGLDEQIAFKGVGKAYIRFAAERPKLFSLLFMSERAHTPSIDSVLGNIEGSYEKILHSITDNYAVNRDAAIRLYKHLWIYSHGIAVLINTKTCSFGESEISDMLTDVFISLLKAEMERKND